MTHSQTKSSHMQSLISAAKSCEVFLKWGHVPLSTPLSMPMKFGIICVKVAV